jgi:hypothetical protein
MITYVGPAEAAAGRRWWRPLARILEIDLQGWKGSRRNVLPHPDPVRREAWQRRGSKMTWFATHSLGGTPLCGYHEPPPSDRVLLVLVT